MKLQPALRVANGRCAQPAETVRRLECALRNAGPIRYTEQRVTDDLYWGAAESDLLNFPAMGKGATSFLCRAATLAETTEWLALRRVRELPGHHETAEDQVPDALPLAELLAHVATASPAALRKIRQLPRARHWVGAHSLTRDAPVSVPLEYIHGISGTNGLASGNCMEEAILQGALEVFERRAAITVARQRLVMPTIDPASISDPLLIRQLDALRARGVEVVLKDFSFGGELPCLGTYFRNPDRPAEFQSHHLLKVGASFDPAAALSGCLAEYAQSLRLGEAPHTAEADHTRLLTSDHADNFLPLFWFGFLPWRDASFLAEGDIVPFEPTAPTADIRDDIDRAIAIAARLGKELIAVDLTDPAIGFPVAQVIMPGYSDLLPYHPATSPVLFTGWTRDLSLGDCRDAAGKVKPCPASAFFPDM